MHFSYIGIIENLIFDVFSKNFQKTDDKLGKLCYNIFY